MTDLARALYGDDFTDTPTSVRGAYARYRKRALLSPSDRYETNTVSIRHVDVWTFLRNDTGRYSFIAVDLFHGFDVSDFVGLYTFIDGVYDLLDHGGYILLNATRQAQKLESLWRKTGYCVTSIQYKQNTMLRIDSPQAVHF